MNHIDPIVDKIIVARIGLLLRHPFFGNMATRLKIIDGSDWLTTAATDGKAIYYNREFFEKLTTKNVEFVVCHEILHCIFDHMSRVENRDKQIWNAAADYCVNGQLVRDRIGEVPAKIKIFHDPVHYGKSAEEIYDEIYDDLDEQSLAQLGQMLDEHVDWEADDGTGKPKYTKDELKNIRDQIKESIISASQTAGNGQTPECIRKLISELTEPKMNWRELLRQQIQSTIKNDYTFMRVNRKSWHMNAILPGTNYDETIDIAVALDMSGSIGQDQALDFITEVKGIMDEYRDYKIKLWTFDTKVYNEQDFDGHDNDILDYDIIGGGGTDFMCNWKYMEDNDIVPKKLIMFTDGLPFGEWGIDGYCDTMFIIHGSKSIVPPFGSHAYYDFSNATA